MADNVTADPGSGGATFATDEIGGVHYPLTKLGYGADGEYTPLADSTPLPTFDDANNGLLRRILLMLMSPLGFDKSLQRQRGTVIVESGTVSIAANQDLRTVAAVTSLNGINGRNSDMDLNANINTAWALNVRARIT